MTESIQAPTKSILKIEDMWAGYDGEAVLEDIQFEMFAGDYVASSGQMAGGQDNTHQGHFRLASRYARKCERAGTKSCAGARPFGLCAAGLAHGQRLSD